MKKLFALFLILGSLSIIRTEAQIPVFQNVTFVSSAPSGSCSNGSPVQVVISTGLLYSCQSGTWAAAAGSVSGTVGSGTANSLTCYPSTGTAVGACTGITTDGSGNLTANGLVSGSISGSVWVDGTHYARTNAGIQAAIAAAPANGTVIIPPGTYTLSATTGQQILIDGTGATHILCLGVGTNLQLQNSAGAIPVIRMKPASQGTYEGWSIEGCQFTTASQGLGTYAIEIDPLINANLGKLRISDNIIGYSAGGPSSVQGFGTGSIYWNNSVGEPNGGIFDSTVENNVILGEFTLTSIGDSNSWHNNLITANFPTTDVCNVSFTAGSAKFRFYNNTDEIPVHFGASAYKLQIADNEFEGEFSNLAGSNGAMLDLDGTSANPVVAAAIAGNSFQIGVMTLNFVRLNFTSDTVIGGIASPNSFTYHTSGNIDIVTTANSLSTTVGENKTGGTPQAVFVSDSATTGQTIFQDLLWSNGAYVPAIYQDKSGTVYYAARDGGSAMQAADGAIELFSGSTSPSTALMLGGINFTAPSTATIASVGNLFSNGYIETGAAHPTVSGCGTISSQVGGGLAGTFVTSATSCTPVLTALPSTTNGYACVIWDQTHPTTPEGNVSSTASSATFGTFSTTASDVVAFNCGISY